jgi:Caspase domain
MRACVAIVFAVLAFCASSQAALAEKRVALVVGNSAYENVVGLTNPAHDAAAIADMFKRAGFDVVDAKHDLKNAEMRRALREFTDKARDADIAVIYYAGHGIEVNGVNYLVPVDAMLERDTDAYDEAISLDRILQAIEPAKRLHLVILDACRNNPFLKKMTRTVASRSMDRGLIGIEPNGQNTLIAYAAKAGFTAMDGDGQNSPFALALLKHLTTPGLDLRRSLGLVRDEVLAATANKQEPYYTGSLGGEDMALVPAPVAPPAAAKSDVRGDYELAERVGTRDAWDSFIAAYPSGFYADLAKAQRNKLAAETERLAATEKARAAAEEKARLAAEGAKASEQARAAAEAKATEDARLAAEKKKQAEEAKVALAAQANATAQAKAAEKAAEDQRLAAEKARLAQENQKRVDEAKAAIAAKSAEAAAAASEKAKTQQAVIASAEQPKTTAEKAAEARPTSEKPRDQVIAALPPSDQANPKVSTPDQSVLQDIPRMLQSELKRVGCSVGEVNGEWNGPSRKALDSFNRNAGTKFDIKLASLDALDAVRGKSGRVCPLECDSGYRATGDHCVKITCDDGQVLGSNGVCHAKPERQRAERERPERERAPTRRTPSGGGSKCFSFEGSRVCQ